MTAKAERAAGGAGDPLLASRGRRPELTVGQPVKISYRCGEWGEGNLGVVHCVAEKADHKGRYFVGVCMHGMPGHRGRPECSFLTYLEAIRGAPPLPHFEAGLVEKV